MQLSKSKKPQQCIGEQAIPFAHKRNTNHQNISYDGAPSRARTEAHATVQHGARATARVDAIRPRPRRGGRHNRAAGARRDAQCRAARARGDAQCRARAQCRSAPAASRARPCPRECSLRPRAGTQLACTTPCPELGGHRQAELERRAPRSRSARAWLWVRARAAGKYHRRAHACCPLSARPPCSASPSLSRVPRRDSATRRTGQNTAVSISSVTTPVLCVAGGIVSACAVLVRSHAPGGIPGHPRIR
jgi:hypothetical protein